MVRGRVRGERKEFNSEFAENAESAEKKRVRVKRRDWVQFDRKSPPFAKFAKGGAPSSSFDKFN